MLLITHVIIAISSMAYTTFAFFLPSQIKIRISQSLVALTLASGTYLVVSMKANMLRACVTGLVYTAIVSFGIYAASRRLATENDTKK